MRKPSYPEKAPYLNGHLLHMKYRWIDGREGLELRDNTPFEETLLIEDIVQSSSTTLFYATAENGDRYHFFAADMLDVLKNESVIGGIVTGTWIVGKRGPAYGLRRYPEAE